MPAPTRLRALAPAAAALALCACARGAPPPDAGPEAAAGAVRAFFAALPSGDCARLAPLLAEGGGARPCDAAVRELQAHGVELVQVLDARPDGRAPGAVMVRAQLAHRGVPRATPTLLRVEQQGGAWRLRW